MPVNDPDNVVQQTVFVLQHSYSLDDEAGCEETKFIGVYSTRAEAEKAVVRLKKQPGFSRLPDYFYIDEYELNQDNWSEGFVTARSMPVFAVWRTDSGGNIFLITDGLVEADALRLVRDLERKDDTQKYWIKEQAG